MTYLNRLKDMKSALWAIIFIAAGCILAACGDARSNAYSEYHTLPSGGWRFGDGVVFTPVHPDSLCRGRIVVAFSHDNSYPYTDIRLEVGMTDGARPLRDTIDIPLAGEFGQWLGCGMGALFQVSDTLGDILHISGRQVEVRHLMRVDTLVGIKSVGIFFVPIKDKAK